MNRKIYVKEKLLIDILKAVLIVLFSIGIYYVWVTFYNPYIPKKLYRGSFLICFLFGVVYFFLAQTYGAFMIGTSTVSDLIYSHGILSMLFRLLLCSPFILLLRLYGCSLRTEPILPFIRPGGPSLSMTGLILISLSEG